MLPFETLANFAKFITTYDFIDGRMVKFLTSISKGTNQRFYDSYEMLFVGADDEQIDRMLFSITTKNTKNVDNVNIKEYYSFEEFEVEGSPGANYGKLEYSDEEISFFRDRYAPVDPEIQVDLTPPTGNYNSSQDAIENSGISDSSLSSLGESVEEEFTITATAGSATELITTATEEISDVGGTVSRDREIQSTGVTVGGGGSTRTVTTSGY